MSELTIHSFFMENTPIDIVFEKYLQYGAMIKGFKNQTLQGHRETFRLVHQETNAKTIGELDLDMLEQMFMTVNAERNWSPYTFFTRHKNLKAFFTWAVIRGYVRTNPMLQIGKPRLPKSIPKALSEEQTEQVLDASYHIKWYIKAEGIRNRAIVGMFIFAGLRRKELCDLKRQDVDLNRREIFIYDGKGGKDRVVQINSRLHYFLRTYVENRDKRYRDNVYFFVSLKDHKPLGVSAMRRIFNRLKSATGIHVTPHMLRHTFATLTYRSSKDIKGVSQTLGHSDVKTTQIYVHASTDDLRKVVDSHPLNC